MNIPLLESRVTSLESLMADLINVNDFVEVMGEIRNYFPGIFLQADHWFIGDSLCRPKPYEVCLQQTLITRLSNLRFKSL